MGEKSRSYPTETVGIAVCTIELTTHVGDNF